MVVGGSEGVDGAAAMGEGSVDLLCGCKRLLGPLFMLNDVCRRRCLCGVCAFVILDGVQVQVWVKCCGVVVCLRLWSHMPA